MLRNGRWTVISACVLGCAFAIVWSSVAAAAFDSGSTGADGAFDLTGTPGGTVVDFDPVVLGFDTDQDGIYNFTTVAIPTDVTVRFQSNTSGSAPIIWLASGAVQIDGTLDLAGENAHADVVSPPALPGPGGFPGAAPTVAPNLPQDGFGPGAGNSTSVNGSGAGHGTGGISPFGSASGGDIYGNAFLIPLLGGSGGGAGQGPAGSGGGAGGGAILIASSSSIVVNGTIDASGGDATTSGTVYFGGGGSGGSIRLIAPILQGTGSLVASGGSGYGGTCNGCGGLGRIRLEAHQVSGPTNFTGVTRSTTLAPNTPLLPSAYPSVRVTTVAGMALPTRPTGSFQSVDVTLNEPTTTTIDITGANIPPGTTVDVTVWNETDGFQQLNGTLTGTLASTTASVSVTFPPGFSRIFTRATW